MQYVGIDVSSLKHDCTIVTDQREILKDGLTIGNDPEGFEALISAVQKHGGTPENTKIRNGRDRDLPRTHQSLPHALRL